MRVESRADEHEIRLETLCRRLEHVFERVGVLIVSRTGSKRCVHDKPLTGTFAALIGESAVGVCR